MAPLPGADALHQLSALGSTKTLAKTTNVEKAKQQAQEFESVFLSTVLAQMFSTVEGGSGPLGGEGTGGETWRSFLTDEYADQISKAGGIGIADDVMREIIRMQEQNS
jgi:Rod binding domain-containing protein